MTRSTRSQLVLLAISTSTFIAGVVIGNTAKSPKTIEAAASAPIVRAPPNRREVRPVHLNVPRLAAPEPPPPIDGDALLSSLRKGILTRATAFEAAGIEVAGDSVSPYLQGALLAIHSLAPEAVPAMRSSMTERLCSQNVPDLERMFFAKMTLIEPAVAAPRAIDCAIANQGTENAVLWALLDAWRAAGQPPSEAVRLIRANAHDPRTRQRLLSKSEEEAFRIQESVGARKVTQALTTEERTNAQNRKQP